MSDNIRIIQTKGISTVFFKAESDGRAVGLINGSSKKCRQEAYIPHLQGSAYRLL